MRSLFSYKKALPQSRQGRSTETKNQANLLVGLYHTSAIKINSTVNNKLIGYTSMIVWKVRLQGKTRYTYAHHGQAAALNSCSSTAVAATGSANSGSRHRQCKQRQLVPNRPVQHVDLVFLMLLK